MCHMLLASLAVVLLGAEDARQDQQQVPAPPPAGALNPGLQGQFQPQQPPGGMPIVGQPGQQFKDVVPALIESLKDSEPEVRQCAAATLVVIGREAVPSLLDMLKGKETDGRANAAYVLGQMGQNAQAALPALVKAMKDDDKAVRVRAAFAVHAIVRDMRESPGIGGMPGMGGPGGFGVRGGRPRSSMDVADPGLVSTGGTPRKKEEPAKDEQGKK
jgi:hypothetical protein